MATSKCFSLVRGRAMRVTRLDGCGAVVTDVDSCNAIVSDGFVSVAFTAQIEEGEAIRVTNAAGRVCVADTPTPQFTGYAVVVTFCQVDPELYALMTGQDVVFDSDGIAVGFRMNSDVDASQSAFALETWSNVPAQQCEEGGGEGTFGYLLVPFLQGGVLGDFTIENGAVTFTLSNARTKTGSTWGTGPYDVAPTGAAGAAGRLATPIKTGDHLHIQLTNVAPPDPGCGCRIEADTAVAGTPGTYTPAGADAPADLTALRADVVADPTTAWTTGQYVVLGDDSTAYWDGDSWEAGTAP